MTSLRWRLIAHLGLFLSVLLLVMTAGIYLSMDRLLGEKFDKTLTAKARALITASEIDDGDFEIDLTVKNFAGFGKEGNDFFEIRRADETVFKRSPSFSKGHQAWGAFGTVSRPPDEQAVMGEQNFRMVGTQGSTPAQIIAPKGDKQNRFQDLYLIVASSTERLDKEMIFGGCIGCSLGDCVASNCPRSFGCHCSACCVRCRD